MGTGVSRSSEKHPCLCFWPPRSLHPGEDAPTSQPHLQLPPCSGQHRSGSQLVRAATCPPLPCQAPSTSSWSPESLHVHSRKEKRPQQVSAETETLQGLSAHDKPPGFLQRSTETEKRQLIRVELPPARWSQKGLPLAGIEKTTFLGPWFLLVTDLAHDPA